MKTEITYMIEELKMISLVHNENHGLISNRTNMATKELSRNNGTLI